MADPSARAEGWPDGTRDLRYLAPGETPTIAEWSAHARNARREARELAELARLHMGDHGESG